MAWFDDLNLPGATIDGYFGFIQADGPDDDDYPDVVLANGTVTFTATTEAARIDGAWLGIESVTAQIFEGQIVISEEDPRPVRLLATDAPIGVADWAWRASFNVPGFRLNDLTFRAPRNTTVNLTADLIPIKSQPYQIIEGASIVDAEVSGEGAMRFELSDGTFTRWMDVPNGERGIPGEKGDTGSKGADGASATLAMGSATAGTTADAWMTGTPLARELHLTLPRGQKGDKGDTGDKGDPGDPATPITASVTVAEGDEWDASVTFTGGNLGLDFTAAPAGPHTHPVSDVTGLATRLAALEAQIQQVAQENGTPPGFIPIFATLAEAEAWEGANPGRVALTIEPPFVPTPGDVFTTDSFTVDGPFFESVAGQIIPLRETENGVQWEDAKKYPTTNAGAGEHGEASGGVARRDNVGAGATFAAVVVPPSPLVRVEFDYLIADSTGATSHLRLLIGGYVVHVNPSGNSFRLMTANPNAVVQTASVAPAMTGHLAATYDGYSIVVENNGAQVAAWSVTDREPEAVGFSVPTGGWIDNFEVTYV